MSLTADTRLANPSPPGTLKASLPVWGLLGHSLLVAIGQITIVPFPWTATLFYEFMCEHVALPDGRRLKFTGRGGDIWYVFMAIPLMFWAIEAASLVAMGRYPSAVAFASSSDAHIINVLSLAANVVLWVFSLVILRWVVEHVTSEDGTLSLGFDGGIAAFVGWNILFIVSFITIVGWAWVMKGMLRWICRHVTGSLAFDFLGGGGAILWRTLVLWLTCLLILPIPWMIRWYTNWLLSQIGVMPPAART